MIYKYMQVGGGSAELNMIIACHSSSSQNVIKIETGQSAPGRFVQAPEVKIQVPSGQ